MKKNLLKRISVIASAMAIGTTAVSCGKSTQAKELQTADQLIHNSYRSIDIDLTLDVNYIDEIKYLSSSGEVLVAGRKDDEDKYYLIDKDMSSAKELNLKIEKPKNGYITSYAAAGNDGNITVLANITDFGDFKLPDYEDPDFDYDNYDFEAMEKAAKQYYKMYTFDLSGNVTVEAKELDVKKYTEDEEWWNVYSIDALNDGNILINSSSYVIIMDKSGKVIKDQKLQENSSINSMIVDESGMIDILKYDEDKKLRIYKYNSSTLEAEGEPIDVTDIENGVHELISSEPDTIYAKNNNGILKIKDGKAEEVLNWVDSDINGNKVSNIIPLQNGDFIIFDEDNKISRLTMRDAAELKDTKVITLAVMYASDDIVQKVTDYNKTSKDYRIKLVDYEKYNDYSEGDNCISNTGEEQLKKDIIAGKAPDMMIINSRSTLKLLAKKDALVDLYELMENDPEITKDKIMPSALRIGESDGKLVGFVPSFYAMTMVCKSKYANKQGWTFEDIKAAYEKLPKGAQLTDDDSKESVFDILMYSADNKFINTDKGTCSFDDPEFVEILEFCNQFPEKSLISQLDIDNFTAEEWEKFDKEDQLKYINDKAMLYTWDLCDLKGYNELKKVIFNEDISLVGFPTSGNGNGGVVQATNYYSILKDSPAKEECWKFLKTFFNEEAQNEDLYGAFPSLISAFEKKADDSTKKDYYIDDKGKKEEYDRSSYVGDKEIIIPPLTEEEKNSLIDYVKNIDYIMSDLPIDIYNILKEETKAYFAGEKTAQAAAEMIQSRASILLSEQA